MPKNANPGITKLTTQTPTSGSLRSTIPHGVVSALGLKKEDFVIWEIRGEGKRKYAKIQQVRKCKT